MHFLAHVKWFVENDGYPKFTLNFTESLAVTMAIILGLVTLFFLNKVNWFNFLDKYSSKLKDFLPLIVRLMAAATIFLNLNSAVFLAPNFDNSTLISKILTPILVVIASMFVIGFYTKYAAFGLLASYLVTFFAYNPFDVLDHLELVGISLFLTITGSGLVSYDNKIGKVRKPSNSTLKKASRQLLMWSGGAIAVLAVTEKLLGIELANSFLAIHNWNFLSGLGVSDYYFILIAGTFELIVGLSLILGLATRLATLGVLVLMVITASLLGVKEIYGHLFAVAVVACSWVYIPSKKS